MSFDCSLAIPKLCKGDCCGLAPMPKQTWIKHRSKAQREVVEVMKFPNDFVVPRTEDNVCPFLNDKYACVIYSDRPEVCQKFGDGTHECLNCPFINPDGSLKIKK